MEAEQAPDATDLHNRSSFFDRILNQIHGFAMVSRIGNYTNSLLNPFLSRKSTQSSE
jgi:hypothetical protein